MNVLRRILSLALCVLLVFSLGSACLAANNYSSWFQASYNEIMNLGLLPSSFVGLDLTKDITRGEMCRLATYAFEKATGNGLDLSDELNNASFTDTSDPEILKASLYGIVSGYPDGTFRPDALLTRQEFFKIIENFCRSAAFQPTAKDSALSGFADSGAVSDWARASAQICVSYGYVQGTKAGGAFYLNPKSTTSRQEALAMFLRCFKILKQYYYELVLSATVQVDQSDLNVTITDVNKTMYVCTETLNVRDSWTTNSTKVGELKYNTAVTVTGICSNGWVRIKFEGHTAYVSGKYLSDTRDNTVTPVTPTTPGTSSGGSSKAVEIANYAMSFIGYSYVWGGASPKTGFDCSGLMYYVLTQYGYSMNRVADDQMNQGTAVSRDNLQIGDLVFFGSGSYANHVGMYIGNNNFVHASSPTTGVRINSLDETYYRTRYIGARRIITG